MNNNTGRLNPYCILINNQNTVHIFSNRYLLTNVLDADEPINVYSSGGATHCSKTGTLKNIREVYLHENGLANILSYAKVRDNHNIAYNDVQDIFTIHTPYKQISFQRIKMGLYYHTCKPNDKMRDFTLVHTVEENKQGFTNREIRDSEKARSAYNMVGLPSAADFERMVRGNLLKHFPIILPDIKDAHTIFGPDISSLRSKTVRKNRNSNIGLCGDPQVDQIHNENN